MSINVYCTGCDRECGKNHNVSYQGRPYCFGCKAPPNPTPSDPRNGRGYYEEDAPGYDEAS